MNEQSTNPKKKSRLKLILIIAGIVVAILIFLVVTGIFSRGSSEIYPDTDQAPVIELSWDGKLDPNEAIRYTPYGLWEGTAQTADGTAYEPANEMQFYMKTDAENLVAGVSGIVTRSEGSESQAGHISIQYGKNYVVSYLHAIPKDGLKSGDKVEVGDVIGKMEKKNNPNWGEETWWEVLVTTKVDSNYRSLPPYDYFSSQGKEMLNAISEASKEKISGNYSENFIEEEGSHGWTIVDGCSWIKYTKEPSWWDSNRFSGLSLGGETEQDFLDSLGLGWKVGDEQGRVIGPKDTCN